jgi:four helix bundle protein
MDFKKLLAFRKGFKLAMEIFEITKTFPTEEKYSLTDQIRRSSRSTCGQIAEAYRKRLYIKHFISKLSDGDGENSETQVWLAFAFTCKYIDQPTFQRLTILSEEVGKLIGHMMKNPHQFGVPLPKR